MFLKIKKWILTYKTEVIFAYIITLLAYGFMFFNHTVSIDEETWLMNTSMPGGWLEQGRIAIYAFDVIFSRHGAPAPFLWDFLAVTTWFFSGIVYLVFIREEWSELKRFSQFAFLVYFTTLPFVAGQMMSFSMSSFPVATGILSVAFALWFTKEWIETKEKSKLLYSVLLLTYGIAIYQAIFGLYVVGIVGFCLLRVLHKKLNNFEIFWKSALQAVIAVVILEITTIGISLMAGYEQQAYLTENFIGWTDEGGVLKALFMAVANVARVSFAIPFQGVTIYGGVVICVLTLGFILWAILTFAKANFKGQRSQILFFSVAFVCAPFIIYLLLGTYKTQGRMLLGLCLSGGMQLLLILNSLKKPRQQVIGIVIVSYLLFLNVSNVNYVYFYDYVRYNQDQTIGNEIMYSIQRLGYDYHSTPVVFVGMHAQDDLGFEKHDTLGTRGSYFRWDDGNTLRMTNFLKTQGYVLAAPSVDQIREAEVAGRELSSWPAENSIVEKDGCIIVKLSEADEKWFRVNGVVTQ